MKPFYSLLYVPVRPEVKEILSVGLLLRDNEKLFYRYSKSKLDILKELLPQNAFHLLKLSLRSVEQAVISAEKGRNEALKALIPHETISQSVLAEPYIQYLSTYNKNLLVFTTPQYIEAEVSFDLFLKLFRKLVSEVDSLEPVMIEQSDLVLKTKEALKLRIEKRVNWDFEVSNSHFRTLILPKVKVDFIGRNGLYVAGETVNFDKSSQHLENDVAKFITLISAMQEENNKSKYYVLGKEPDKNYFPNQHKMWKNIHYSKSIDLIDADEYEKVVEYIESNNVMPIE